MNSNEIYFHSKQDIDIWIKENNINFDLSKDERNAIKSYSSIGYDMNCSTRDNRSYTGPMEKVEKEFKNMFSKNILKQNIVVYRGLQDYGDGKSIIEQMIKKYNDFVSIDKKIQNTFTPYKFMLEDAYCSTSLMPTSIANNDEKLEIHLPIGTHFIYIGDLSESPEQCELVLDRNSIFKILQPKYNENYLRVELINDLNL
jgi:Txe/YoeB family toxin of Txe-Axe toxin-antitoxin module